MANTLTNLIPTVVQGFDVVSRELVGLIPSVTRDPRADRVAKNQTLYSWLAPVATLGDITPAATVPAPTDKAFTSKSITITNFKVTSFGFTGEEQGALGDAYDGMVSDLIQQSIRAITNQMEADIFAAAYVGASRGYGTAGTTPFASTVGDSAQMKKILDDNGAPGSERSLILDTTAGAALRTLGNLSKANEAGTVMTLRDGQLLSLNGLSIKESAAVTTATAGTAASATTNNAGYAVGTTTLTLAAAGTGTILAGDVITFAGDTNKYVVTSGDADVSNGGTITIAEPGLKVAMSAATKAITVSATSTRNIGLSRNAVVFASRLCALPREGDIASDREVIVDPRSGMAIEFAFYKQYRQVRYELSAAWSATVVKPEHLAILLG